MSVTNIQTVDFVVNILSYSNSGFDCSLLLYYFPAASGLNTIGAPRVALKPHRVARDRVLKVLRFGPGVVEQYAER
jgi:hypothetical protein